MCQLGIGILESSAHVDEHAAISGGEMLSFLEDRKSGKREGKVLYLRHKSTVATIASPSSTPTIMVNRICFGIYSYGKPKMLSPRTLIALFARYDGHAETAGRFVPNVHTQ